MDFELKEMRPGDALAPGDQALVVLLGRDDTGAAFKRQGKGGAALAALLDKARKSGDFGGRAGELLGAFRTSVGAAKCKAAFAAGNGIEHVLGQLNVIVRKELVKLLARLYAHCLFLQLGGKVF